MALGYEGVIKIGSYYALGTGTSVPRARMRLESASGYGGNIKDDDTPSDFSEMGIGAPHNYDWNQYDGTVNFELTQTIWQYELKTWLFDRQSKKEIFFQTRKDNVQDFKDCYWNSISLSASEGAVIDGSVGFVGLTQETYVWGDKYINNKQGLGLLCPLDPYMPLPLNAWAQRDKYPLPYWFTEIYVKPSGGSSIKYNFTTWGLDFSQEIVKFFGCTQTSAGADPGAKEPIYLAAGPMTVVFTGSYILDFDASPIGYFGNDLDEVRLVIGSTAITLKRLELTSESDDVQTGDAVVPLTVEYAAYEIAA